PPLATSLERSGGHAIARVTEAIAAKGAGNFLVVQQTLDGLASGLYHFDELKSLPPGLPGHYLRFFDRHFPDAASYLPVKRILQVIVAAEEPLTEKQIGLATGLDLEDQLPALLAQLAPFVPGRRGTHDVVRYSVYHKTFADW